jgi:hypothetical protein
VYFEEEICIFTGWQFYLSTNPKHDYWIPTVDIFTAFLPDDLRVYFVTHKDEEYRSVPIPGFYVYAEEVKNDDNRPV